MDERHYRYMDANRANWETRTAVHVKSRFYDVPAFRAGRNTLHALETEEMGPVVGKRLLHLQCHFGLDTLSWARLGALVTGVDFSEAAITEARSLSTELRIPATFVASNVYDLETVLAERFQIVFTSYGALVWLPDLDEWGRLVARYLQPGGVFYVVDLHPFADVFDNERSAHLSPQRDYFSGPEPTEYGPGPTYTEDSPILDHNSFEWTHTLGEVVTALAGAGLRIEFVHEFPFCMYQHFPFLERHDDGWWHLPSGMPRIPLLFSARAVKP
jgi:SAM-dependent methyltransferase